MSTHLEAQLRAIARNAHADAAALGEVHGVADEIDEHLPQPRRIALDLARRIGRDEARNFQPLFESARREQFNDALDERRERESLMPQIELAGFDL